MSNNSRLNIAILFIIIFAAALRLFSISSIMLNESEAFAFATASQPLETLFRIFINNGDKHLPVPFLYILIIKPLIYLGASVSALRLLGVLLGVVSLVLVYIAAKKLAGSAAAVITALLLSISPYFLIFSRSLSHHALLFFLIAFITWLFLKILEANFSPLLYIAYVVACFAAVLLYPPAAILMIPFIIVFYLYARADITGRAVFTAINLVLLAGAAYWSLRWLPTVLKLGAMFSTLSETVDIRLLPAPHLYVFKFVEIYLKAFYAMSGLFCRDLSHPTAWHVIAFIPVLIFFHIAMFYGFKPNPNMVKERTILFLLLAFSVPVCVALSVIGVPAGEAVLPAVLFFVIIIACGIVRNVRPVFRIALAATVLCMFIASVPDVYRRESARTDWHRITGFLQQNIRQDEAVVILDGWLSPPYFYYADNELASRTYPLFPDFALRIVNDHRLQEDIARPFRPVFDTPPAGAIGELAEKYNRLWVVYKEKFPELNPRIEANSYWLEDNTATVGEKRFPHITLELVQLK
ncbi:MAG: glycosyltransferase family 39 protein [bacterium]